MKNGITIINALTKIAFVPQWMIVCVMLISCSQAFAQPSKSATEGNAYKGICVADEIAMHVLEMLCAYDESTAESYHMRDSLKTLYDKDPIKFRKEHKIKTNVEHDYMTPRPTWVLFYDLVKGKSFNNWVCERFTDKVLFESEVGIYCASFAFIMDNCRVIIVKEGTTFTFYLLGAKAIFRDYRDSQMFLYLANLHKKHPNVISAEDVLLAIERIMGSGHGLNDVGTPDFETQKTIGGCVFRTVK